MNHELTEIVMIVDESGSMGSIRKDTIGSFNLFLEDQKKFAGSSKALLTLVTFNYITKTIVNGVDINEVEPLTEANYRPGGGTALLDAVGQTIDSLEDRYIDLPASEVPGKVIIAIITDGEENTSKRYTKAQIAKMIKHQTNRHGWEFAFLGANLDAVEEAKSIGISGASSFNFAADSNGMADVMGVLSSTTRGYRATGYASYDVSGTSLEGMNVKADKVTVDGTAVFNGGVTIKNGNITKG